MSSDSDSDGDTGLPVAVEDVPGLGGAGRGVFVSADATPGRLLLRCAPAAAVVTEAARVRGDVCAACLCRPICADRHAWRPPQPTKEADVGEPGASSTVTATGAGADGPASRPKTRGVLRPLGLGCGCGVCDGCGSTLCARCWAGGAEPGAAGAGDAAATTLATDGGASAESKAGDATAAGDGGDARDGGDIYSSASAAALPLWRARAAALHADECVGLATLYDPDGPFEHPSDYSAHRLLLRLLCLRARELGDAAYVIDDDDLAGDDEAAAAAGVMDLDAASAFARAAEAAADNPGPMPSVPCGDGDADLIIDSWEDGVETLEDHWDAMPEATQDVCAMTAQQVAAITPAWAAAPVEVVVTLISQCMTNTFRVTAPTLRSTAGALADGAAADTAAAGALARASAAPGSASLDEEKSDKEGSSGTGAGAGAGAGVSGASSSDFSSSSASEEAWDVLGLFPSAAMVNHSCRPNAAYALDSDGCLRVTAVGHIAAGTQACVPYVDPGLAGPLRRERLARDYYFECSCEVCAAELPAD